MLRIFPCSFLDRNASNHFEFNNRSQGTGLHGRFSINRSRRNHLNGFCSGTSLNVSVKRGGSAGQNRNGVARWASSFGHTPNIQFRAFLSLEPTFPTPHNLSHLEARDDIAETIFCRGAGFGGYQLDKDGSERIPFIGRLTQDILSK
jgi:hypothetical protein